MTYLIWIFPKRNISFGEADNFKDLFLYNLIPKRFVWFIKYLFLWYKYFSFLSWVYNSISISPIFFKGGKERDVLAKLLIKSSLVNEACVLLLQYELSVKESNLVFCEEVLLSAFLTFNIPSELILDLRNTLDMLLELTSVNLSFLFLLRRQSTTLILLCCF